jgi:hypothetical protein
MCERKVIVIFAARHKQAFVLRKIVLLCVLLFLLARPAAARACGMPLDAHIPAEQALIVFTGGREEIITSVRLQSDKPGAMVHTVFVNGWERMALPIAGLILVIISSSVALGIAFGLRRRMNQIAGPDPEEDDD